jgi:ubiquinone/menaquinone biosynthesis C-methylase UbiE
MTSGCEGRITFDDGGREYERFMGRWSRAAGALFLNWLSPPKRTRWLELGCGTGAFTEIVLRSCAPAAIVAIDSAASQVDWARRQLADDRLEFRVADAHHLPFGEAAFDVIASALVLNFLSDRKQALREVRRVGRSGALVGAYVWDFAADRAPNSMLVLALRRIGIDVPVVPGTEASTLEALTSLFQATGLTAIDSTRFDLALTFSDFDEFWTSQTPSFSPVTKILRALSAPNVAKLTRLLRDQAGSHGAITIKARAHAVKARVP